MPDERADARTTNAPTEEHPPTSHDTPVGRKTGPAGARTPEQEQRDERTDYHSRHAEPGRTDQSEADQVQTDRNRADQVRADQDRTDQVEDRQAAVLPAATPRPRSSGLATIGLVLAVVAALAVATGVLAAPGVALGVLGLLFGIGGISATSRRHVAGRLEAVVAVLLSLAAVVVGVLALSDALSWLDTDTNQVTQLRDWLDDRLPWLDDL